jgi:hypothetical protein
MAGTHAAPGPVRRALRATRRRTETSDYVAFLERVIAGYGDRIGEDPAALVHLRELELALANHTNRGIFQANKSAAHYSQNDMAAILGTSRQAIAKRIRAGEDVYALVQQARGGGALIRIGDVRARRAAGLHAAGVADVTGSPRELRAAASDGW